MNKEELYSSSVGSQYGKVTYESDKDLDFIFFRVVVGFEGKTITFFFKNPLKKNCELMRDDFKQFDFIVLLEGKKININTTIEELTIQEKIGTLSFKEDVKQANTKTKSNLIHKKHLAYLEEIFGTKVMKIKTQKKIEYGIPKGFYVYEHYILESNIPFYIGKGKGMRCYNVKRNKAHDRIWNLNKCGVKIIKEGLDELEALRLESQLILDYAKKGIVLTNISD